MAISCEQLTNGTKVYISEAHRFGSDALLLADYIPTTTNKRICELGSGCGIILLALHDKGSRGHFEAVEISGEACELMQRAVSENNLPAFHIHHGDMRAYKTGQLFDILVCNPPYFSTGLTAQNSERANARHLLAGNIGDWCRTAAACLKDKGRFYLCFPPAGLPGLVNALCANRLAPAKIQLVKQTPEKSPWLCLIEAVKRPGSKPFNPDGLTFLPDKIMELCHY